MEEKRDLIAEMQGDTKSTQSLDEWELGKACDLTNEKDCEACQ